MRALVGQFIVLHAKLHLPKSLSTPPADIHVYERNLNTNMQDMQDTSPVDSSTAMLNCGNESTGGSFIVLHAKLHLPKLSVPVGLFPDMPVDYDHHDGNHPIDSANATFSSHSMANSMDSEFASGFNFGSNEFDFANTDTNFDFEKMDSLGLGNPDAGATFNYEQAFMEAAISIGVQENKLNNFQAGSSQLVLALYPSPLSIDSDTILTSADLSSPALSSTSGVLSAPTLPEPDDIHAHHRPTKRKKVNEVNAAHILPEGLQRSRTKSAKAAAALEST
jgi:hypothetical protein